MQRAPKRPRKVLTGKPVRPPQNRTICGLSPTNHASTADDSDEDGQEYVDAEFAMSVCKIPFQQAISGPDKDEWHAVYSEIKSLIQNDTFKIVPRPINRKIIKYRTVLRNKYNVNGNISRRKARVMAKGFAQYPGIDFFEIFASVARIGSFQLLMALSAKYDLKVSQLDVKTAYLNEKIDIEVYMEKPELLHETLERIIQENDSQILRRVCFMMRTRRIGHGVQIKQSYLLRSTSIGSAMTH